MNRIHQLFQNKSGNILSIYFTAGHPTIDSTVKIIRSLANAGADMIEIGIPFSDPMADGPVIQKSSDAALKNGMSLALLFEQLGEIRNDVTIPLLLMGYLNPVMQYGIEKFCRKCSEVGIDGVILPDLPFDLYRDEYQPTFQASGILPVFLISPQTTEARIHEVDNASQGFIYMVSASSTTGAKNSFSSEQLAYFSRLQSMNLRNPGLIGFGISTRETFAQACQYAQGAIIGSAFVTLLEKDGNQDTNIRNFIKDMRNLAG
jgi:tryptophan synthase alpha chain